MSRQGLNAETRANTYPPIYLCSPPGLVHTCGHTDQQADVATQAQHPHTQTQRGRQSRRCQAQWSAAPGP